jgi:hypothetical protein
MSRLPELARLLLDNNFLIHLGRGDFDRIRLGSVANFGDEAILRQLKARAHDSKRFADLLTELSYAGWQIAQGNTVRAMEEESAPDLEVTAAQGVEPFMVECKRVGPATGLGRLRKLVNKANRQFRHHYSHRAGVLVIDLCDRISPPTTFSDKLPVELEAFRDEVAAHMHDENRSVSAALLVWVDFGTLDQEAPDGPVSAFCFRRRSRIVLHTAPRVPLTIPPAGVSFESSLMINIRWRLTRVTPAGGSEPPA